LVSTGILEAPEKIVIGGKFFILGRLIALFLVTYIPEISLWLPKALYPKSFL
jgi:TRAP-type C4-dicarboxylate transport system permease large subunit